MQMRSKHVGADESFLIGPCLDGSEIPRCDDFDMNLQGTSKRDTRPRYADSAE